MGKTLSEVKQDLAFNFTTIATTHLTSSRIEILPPAGSVCSFGWDSSGNNLYGYNSSGTVVWTLAANTISGMVRFVANLIKINNTTAYFLAADSGASLIKAGILNLQTGATSSITTITNPINANWSGFGFSSANIYGAGSNRAVFRLKGANFIVNATGSNAQYEFTTAGTSVSDLASNSDKGLYFSADDSCSCERFGKASDSRSFSIYAFDKFKRELSNTTINIGRGAAIGDQVYVWLFGDHVVLPAVIFTANTFLRTEFDKLLKRSILECGGRLS